MVLFIFNIAFIKNYGHNQRCLQKLTEKLNPDEKEFSVNSQILNFVSSNTYRQTFITTLWLSQILLIFKISLKLDTDGPCSIKSLDFFSFADQIANMPKLQSRYLAIYFN